MKYISYALVIFSCIFAGCKTNEKIQVIESDQTIYHMGSSFNDETYVWEKFIFTTNRIDKVY